MSKWYDFRATAKSEEVEVLIYDEIGGWGVNAADFAKDLKAHKGKKLKLRIHSPGGSILDGNAIYNALKRHTGGVDVYIDGLAASMATVVAMAGTKVYAAENSLFMIHNPWTVAIGDSEELRKSADLMDVMKASIVNTYAAKTGKPADDIEAKMDEETWFTAKEAKEYGFVDVVTEPLEIAASARSEKFKAFLSSFEKTPAALTSEKSRMDAEQITETAETTVAETLDSETAALVADVQAKAGELQNKLTAETTRANAAEAKAKHFSDALNLLKKSLGISAAAVIPAIETTATDADAEFIANWNAASEASGARTVLWDKDPERAKRLSNEKKINF